MVDSKLKIKKNEKHKHDLIYYTKCPDASCTEDYFGETGRRIIARVADHAGKNKQSHLLKHALTRNHQYVDLSNMKIIDFNFHNNKFKRKISEVDQVISAITEFPRAVSRTETF